MNGKRWTACDTAEMAALTGRGWPDWRIARKLGFARQTVTNRRLDLGQQPNRNNYWTAPLSRHIQPNGAGARHE